MARNTLVTIEELVISFINEQAHTGGNGSAGEVVWRRSEHARKCTRPRREQWK